MNLFTSVANFSIDAVEYISSIFSGDDIDVVLLSMGFDVTVGDVSTQVQDLKSSIAHAKENGISFDSLHSTYNTLENLSSIYLNLNNIAAEIDNSNIAISTEEIIDRILSYFFLEELWANYPVGLAILYLIGAIETKENDSSRPLSSTSMGLLYFESSNKLHLDASKIKNLFSTPSGLFDAVKSNNKDVIRSINQSGIIALALISRSLGAPLHIEYPHALRYETLSDGTRFEQNANACTAFLGPDFALALVPGIHIDEDQTPHFSCKIMAQGSSTISLAPRISANLDADGEFLIFKNKISTLSSQQTSSKAEINSIHIANNGPVQLGVDNGTRAEAESVEFCISLQADLETGSFSTGMSIILKNATVTIDSSAGDSFLSSLLGNQKKAQVNIGIGLSTDKGIHLVGGDGMSFHIPTHASLGSVSFQEVSVKFSSLHKTLRGSLCGNLQAQLGPLFVTFVEIGLSIEAAFGTGSLGIIDLAKIDFKSPAGAAIELSTKLVAGGGELAFDSAEGRYSGALQLHAHGLAFSATGIVTTQLPDGSGGYSFLILISAEFQGVQLGFGFTLTGVGGLLGINRQADVQALRSNMKNGGLSSIMFPDNVVENAQRIVSDVGAAFPVAEGNYVFGPILRIGWGTPTLFELTMGVVLSFPSPFKVVLIGRFQLGMPSLEYDGDVPPPIWVNIDFLGVIDPSAGLLSLDGVLYDSRLAAFSLEGQFAMQQTFGDDPLFLVSIGGFHPNFEPPPQVPDLKRLSLTLGDSDNPRIRTELYTAITSNTAQVGARVDVFAKAAGFKVLGAAGFDALVVFSPFSLDVTFFIRAAVKRSSSTLFSINVNLNLTGPNPWRAKGEASFEVLFLTVKVRFSLTFGSSEAPRLPETDVLEKLKSALAETRNWSVKLPERTREPAVTFRELPAAISDSLLHPEASLTVRQQVVPLGLDIERYSGAIPTAAGRRVRRFDIESLSLNGTLYSADQPDQITKEKEKFAPGAYLELSDEEKLSRPSFESFTAGATLAGSQGYAIPDSASLKTVVTNYEQSVVDTSTGFAFDFQPLDENGNVIPVEDIKASDAVIFSTVADDSGVKSSVYQPKKLAIRVDDPAYTVVSRGDADRMTNIAASTNFYEANKALKDSGQSKQDYHIVLVHEEKAA